MKENIYALYYEYGDQRHYFYVGRTIDPKRRMSEHRSNVKNKNHQEDVYCFIRERCQPNGIDVWDMEVLVSEENARPEDCEDFWVVLMIRAGHDLKNMKRGDLHRVVLTMMAKKQGDFENVDEFVEFRERVDKEIKQELAAYERSKRLKENVLEETPNPNLDVQALLAAVAARRTEADRRASEKRKKQAARERANILEREAWLKSLREKGIVEDDDETEH
jgi:hypothetical protein